MFRVIAVISILTSTLMYLSCKNNQEPVVEEEYISISGLLTDQDTLVNYEDLGLKRLSDYGFFEQPLHQLIPATAQVVPYSLNSPLFTDYASKKRFIYFPEGSAARYVSDESVLDFPEGTMIIKNFYYEHHDLKTRNSDVILETRLLIRENEEWITLPYIWNEEQTEAYLYILGKDINVVLEANNNRKETLRFSYAVPNINMCKNCHVKDKDLVALGPTPRQLNGIHTYAKGSINQLSYLQEANLVNDLPDLSEIHQLPNYMNDSAPLNDRSRAYLDVNCAHCHQEGGSAKTSGLHLAYQEKDLYKLGVNKPPVAAGKGSGNLDYDIVIGNPDQSILLYRMKHLEPDIKMPELGTSVIHDEGVALIAEWIKGL